MFVSGDAGSKETERRNAEYIFNVFYWVASNVAIIGQSGAVSWGPNGSQGTKKKRKKVKSLTCIIHKQVRAVCIEPPSPIIVSATQKPRIIMRQKKCLLIF